MVTAGTLSCRIAAVLSSTHCITVFSRKSMKSGFAEALCRVLDVPVVPSDGLSTFAGLVTKFLAAESFESASQG